MRPNLAADILEAQQPYNSGKQLPALQLVTWNDYEEGTEIESGIDNCFSLSASVSGGSEVDGQRRPRARSITTWLTSAQTART